MLKTCQREDMFPTNTDLASVVCVLLFILVVGHIEYMLLIRTYINFILIYLFTLNW